MALYQHALNLNEKTMRVIRFPLIRMIIALVFFGVLVSLGAIIADFLKSGDADVNSHKALYAALEVLLQVSAGLLAYWLFVSLIEGRVASELNQKVIRNLFPGLALGFVFISLIMGIMALFGSYRMTGANLDHKIVSIFWMSVSAGIIEELLLRGIFFRLVEELTGTWISVMISALLFGFLHIWNPNATILSSLSIALTAGVVLALLYAITRNLWIVIGMHFAWNFTLGGIYGAPVSGGAVQGLFKSEFSGQEWITGGAFGPEASVITMVTFTLFGLWLVFRTIRVQQVIPPLWSKKKKNHDNDTPGEA